MRILLAAVTIALPLWVGAAQRITFGVQVAPEPSYDEIVPTAKLVEDLATTTSG